MRIIQDQFAETRATLLILTCVLTALTFACNESGEVRWEYVVPDNYEGFLAIRFSCPGGEPLMKDGVAHVEFKSDGTFCTSDPWVPTSSTTWFPTMRRSPHRSASGKSIEKPVEIPKSGYTLCCEGTTTYCDSTFLVLWVGNMPRRNIKLPEDSIKFLHQHFPLTNCSPPLSFSLERSYASGHRWE